MGNLFHIRINSSEENKDAGFFALMTSGASIMCLEDEEYIIDEKALNKLKEKDIKFEKVEDSKVVTKNKIMDGKKDATTTEI